MVSAGRAASAGRSRPETGRPPNPMRKTTERRRSAHRQAARSPRCVSLQRCRARQGQAETRSTGRVLTHRAHGWRDGSYEENGGGTGATAKAVTIAVDGCALHGVRAIG
jgi:hypothetical protein